VVRFAGIFLGEEQGVVFVPINDNGDIGIARFHQNYMCILFAAMQPISQELLSLM